MYANFVTNDSLYSKEVVVLFGSPNIVGSTFRLLYQFRQALTESGLGSFSFRQFDFFDMKVSPCTGCYSCKYGLCYMNHLDGYTSVIETIQAADIIILATPVYFGSYPAPLKAFLDRAQQFFVNDFKGRETCFPRRTQGFLLATAGAQDAQVEASMKTTAKMFFNCINTEFAGTLFSENTDKNPSFHADFENILDSVRKGL